MKPSAYYYGDVEFFDYLQLVCDNLVPLKTSIVLVEILNQIETENKTSTLFDKLNSIQCDFQYNSSSNIEVFQFKTIKNILKKPANVLVLFDFTGIDRLNEKAFANFIVDMSGLYGICANCLPFVAWFDKPISDLNQWSSQHFAKFHKIFRSTLVSKKESAPNAVVHIRPLVQGCLILNKTFVPSTRQHFQMMKLDFHSCDFNSTNIRIAINKVSAVFVHFWFKQWLVL